MMRSAVRNVAPLGHIILTQAVFDFTHYYCVFTGKQQITTRSKRTNHHNTLAVSEFAQCECHGYTIMKMAYYFQLLFWLRETRFRCKINLKYLIKNSTEQEYHVTVSLLTGIVITLDSVVYFDPFASDKELLLHSQTCVRRSPFWGKWSFNADNWL
jgi:hypothetical protein